MAARAIYGFLVAIQGLGSVLGAATLARRVTSSGIRNNLIVGLFASGVGIVDVRILAVVAAVARDADDRSARG